MKLLVYARRPAAAASGGAVPSDGVPQRVEAHTVDIGVRHCLPTGSPGLYALARVDEVEKRPGVAALQGYEAGMGGRRDGAHLCGAERHPGEPLDLLVGEGRGAVGVVPGQIVT